MAAEVSRRMPLRPRPSSQSLGQASTTDASSSQYVTAKSSLHSSDESSLDGHVTSRHNIVHSTLPRSDTLSSSVDSHADLTYTQHDFSHLNDISALSNGGLNILTHSMSNHSFASRSTLSTDESSPHELLGTPGIPTFHKFESTTLPRLKTDTTLTLKDKENLAPHPPLQRSRGDIGSHTKVLGSPSQLNTFKITGKELQGSTSQSQSRTRLPARDIKPVGFPFATSILATQLSMTSHARQGSEGQQSVDKQSSSHGSSHDGHRTSSDVDLDLSFDLPRPSGFEDEPARMEDSKQSGSAMSRDTVVDLRAAFFAAEKRLESEIPIGGDQTGSRDARALDLGSSETTKGGIAYQLSGSPERPPIVRSLSSSPRMANKLPAPLQTASAQRLAANRSQAFVYSPIDMTQSDDLNNDNRSESPNQVPWQAKGKWRAQVSATDNDMNVLDFVLADERDYRALQAARLLSPNGTLSPETSPLFDTYDDGDGEGSTRTAPTTPNDTPVMPEHDHEAIGEKIEEEYRKLMADKQPLQGLGFSVDIASAKPLQTKSQEYKTIPSLSVTRPADEDDETDEDDESGTEESAVDPQASPSRRLSNRFSREQRNAIRATVVIAPPGRTRSRDGRAPNFGPVPRHLLRSETMPGARLPHEKAADNRFRFQPVPLQLVVGNFPDSSKPASRPQSGAGAGTHQASASTNAHRRRHSRPMSVMSFLDLTSYPCDLLDETPPAKLTLWFGFLLGPWLWIIGGWYLRHIDGEVPGTQGKRCRDHGCKCGRMLSRMKQPEQHQPTQQHKHNHQATNVVNWSASGGNEGKWMGVDEWVFWNRVAAMGSGAVVTALTIVKLDPYSTYPTYDARSTPTTVAPDALSFGASGHQYPPLVGQSNSAGLYNPQALVSPNASSSGSGGGIKISTASWLSKHGNGHSDAYQYHQQPQQQYQQQAHLIDPSQIGSMPTTRRSGSFQPATTGRATRGTSAAANQVADHQDMQDGGDGVNPYDNQMYAQSAAGVYQNGIAAGNAGGEDNDDEGQTDKRNARKAKRIIVDSEDEEDEDAEGEIDQPFEQPPAPLDGSHEDDNDDFKIEPPKLVSTTTKSGRKTLRPIQYDSESPEEDDEPVKPARGGLRRGRSNKSGYGDGNGFVEADEGSDDDEEDEGVYGQDRKTRLAQAAARRKAKDEAAAASSHGRTTRSTRKSSTKQDQSYEAEASFGETSEDEELSLDSDDSLKPLKPRRLREKPKIDYYAIPPVESLTNDKSKSKSKRKGGDDPFAGLPHNLTGAQWAALFPDKNGNAGNDSSSSDDDGPGFPTTPRKGGSFAANPALAGLGGGGLFAGGAGLDLGAPSNLGKVGGASSLADTDPLGVSQVSFDSVGGLGSHIQQLKEMVSLPLLYPEVFERFNMSPPRGVLFHGPPGTGKTLLARALAASCSTDGRKIAFFMRKGADCLSKWVGEAERQLRLLFEEAKKCQPSIIFFDEIDGLAPVRSSKQEQIHASIVSTLLALMDGMDGRGQVIVIGATNRPDAIDPALRRPGRFDREFYFPLPNIEGRRKIIDIHTKGWNPPLEHDFKDELAHLTKGYGGADLRALCTEAALNAVQRTFPQIYKTNDRLLIKPEQIAVTARDFIISQKNLIPSTARATSSLAAPLPVQLEPLLSDSLERAKTVLAKVLPEVKKVNVLEDAEYEDDGGGFEKEKMMQAFETLRVFRPRLLICGESGMGQSYVGSAVLHHLEGFHVQPLDLATLVADSTRTMEAACVQLFVEAKRHKPSILFIPSLIAWCHSVGDSVKSTIKGLLDGLDPSDPILLLAVVDGPLSDVPGDVRSWFGFVKGNRVTIDRPSPLSDSLEASSLVDEEPLAQMQRGRFFEEVMNAIQRPPNEFPDAMPRRKRVLEKLPIAPPPPPREPTEAEIKAQTENDQRLLEYLKWKMGPILNELKKRYKRFTRSFFSDWRNDDVVFRMDQQKRGVEIVGLGTQPYYSVDLDTMHNDLYKGHYLTPDDFLADLMRIQANVEINAILEKDHEAPTRAGQMMNHARVMIDQTFDQNFRAECLKLRDRVEERENKLPPGAKSKSRKMKSKGALPEAEDLYVWAQKQAAAGGKGLMATIKKTTAEEGNGDEAVQADGDAIAAAVDESGRLAKRVRIVDDEDSDTVETRSGPSKRAKNDVNGTADDVIMAPLAGSSGSLHVNLGFNEGAGLNAVAPPMQVGAAPETDSATAAMPRLPGLPDAGIALPPHLSQEDTRAATPLSRQGSVERPVTPHSAKDGHARVGGVNGTSGGSARGSPSAASDVNMVPSTPEPLPDFALPSLDSLSTLLRDGTTDLTVDELEQLRAACFDVVWRGRKAWDRQDMVNEVNELVTEFVDEAREARQI
ncbi:TAT-binding protein-like protein 7, AAA ATPase [Microbotryomycetes sp. JL221]|nr:TAT-binding protein-like protein 7, AAA ATPase [Microbotryomycetes sp. JL221]